jgi:catechol 2,3-dioxygenase-like lactoylglutathione lyase family enzyme
MTASIVFDHIALATEHWQDAWPRLAGDLGGRWVSGGQGPGYSPMQLRFANGMKIELLEPHDVERNDFLRRFLDRHGAGPHHLTFKVPDIGEMLAALDTHGFPPINVDLSDPQWKEGFVHPHHTGVVVQVAEAQQEWDAPAPPGIPEPRADVASLAAVVLAVASIDAARALFVDVLHGEEVGAGDDEAARWVELAWRGPGRLRLLEAASAGSPVQQWLGDRSGRIHHIAFRCAQPSALPAARELSDGRWELAPDEATGTRFLVSRSGD